MCVDGGSAVGPVLPLWLCQIESSAHLGVGLGLELGLVALAPWVCERASLLARRMLPPRLVSAGSDA